MALNVFDNVIIVHVVLSTKLHILEQTNLGPRHTTHENIQIKVAMTVVAMTN